MKFAGEIELGAGREAVFDRLKNAAFFASCIDGVHDFQEIDPTHYAAVMETKIAFLTFKFKIGVEVLNSDRPNKIEARIEGTPLGIVGRLTANSVARLTEQSGATKVSYEIDASLTGKLGGIGQPVLRSKAKEMERHFAERLRAAFGAKPVDLTRQAQ